MAIGAIAGLIAKYTLPVVISAVAGKIFGGGRKGRGRSSQAGKNMPAGVTKLSGGGTATQIAKLPPAAQKEIESALPKIIKEFMGNPGKFPELGEVFNQAQKLFPPQELEKMIPELKDLPPTPEMPPEAELSELDFGPTEAKARQKFQEETIPTLAERFTSLTGGGQRSGAFERQKAQAGTDLETNLAALRASLEPEYALQKAQYGLQRGKLGAILGQQGLQRGQMGNLAQLQRGQLMANLGLGQRQQQLQGAQLGLSQAQMAQQPGQFRQRLLANLLSGGVASPFDTAVQPPQPSFMQGIAPGVGQGLGGLMGGLGKAAGSWLFGGNKTSMFN